MIDLTKYLTDEDNIKFVKHLYDYVISQSSIELQYKKSSFLLEPIGEQIQIWLNGECVAHYDNLDDMLLNHTIDGKPFIEQIEYIDLE